MPPFVIFFYKFIFCIPYLTSNVIYLVYTEVANRKFGILRSQSRKSLSQSWGGGALLVSYLLIQVNCFHCWETQFLITLFIHFKFHVDTDLREYDTPICSAPQISRTSFGITLFRQHSHVPLSSQISDAVQGKFWSAVLIKTVRIYIFQTL